MTIETDATTRGQLNGATSKTNWSTLFNTAVGNTRRVICKRDANAAASDVWTSGTIFRNVGSSGNFRLVSGKIATLGRLNGTTVAAAADMLSGKSVLRIQNADGSRWLQGTLGLTRKAQAAAGIAEENIVDYDFVVAKSFTAINGFGVTPNFAVGGRRFLPSGVGPAAPSLDAGAPTIFEMWDWANPNSPVKLNTITLDNRAEDFLYEDTEMALMNGDTAVYQSTQQLTIGEFAVGFTLLASSPSNTEVGNVPLYQVLGGIRSIKPSWSSYPASDTYDFANDNTFLPPFKVVAKNSAGTIITTFELHDGKAINDPTVTTAKQTWTNTHAVRPMVDCYTMLPWQNTRPKVSPKINKFYPGIKSDYRRPSMGKAHFSVNGCEPLFTDGYNSNGSINGWAGIYNVNAWPQPRNSDGLATIQDPYLSYGNLAHDTQQGAPWCEGYAYEPGSKSCHGWYTGPGGVRFDRAFIPATLALFATDPAGTRLQDNTPWRDMADGFLLSNFNHRNHWVRDVKTLGFTPFAEFKAGGWSTYHDYYSAGTEVASPTTIRGNSDQRDGTRLGNFDANGNMVMCGWGRDGQHNYANAGWGALLLNSPLHAIGSRWDTLYACAIGGNPDHFNSGAYMYRTQAWDWLHDVIAWKLASRHNLGIARADIEDRFLRKLEAIYQAVYVPAFIENNPGDYHTGIRNLGNPLVVSQYTNRATQGEWGYFMTGALMLMKQTGMWAAMMARGGHYKTALEMQLRNMDKFCFDGLLDTSGVYWGGYGFGDDRPVPASFADWAVYGDVHDGSGWNHDAAGNVISDRDFGTHLMVQYVYMRRDFFPEIPSPRLTAAVAKMDFYLNKRATAVAAQTTPQDKSNKDSLYGLPGVAPMVAPTELGPA